MPHTHFLIDPKPVKVKDVRNPNKDVRYLVGVSCDPGVFKALQGHNVHRIFTVCGLGDKIGSRISDVDIVRAFFDAKDYAFVDGGTMAGLRAMTIANVLGYKTVEFYGFDSCFYEMDDKGYPIYYSYDKQRVENIMETETAKTEKYESRKYLTSPVFASQARQFIKWKRRLEWMTFIIHGDSLTSQINKIDEERIALKGKTISDYMLKMNKSSHKENENYGTGKCTDVGMTAHAGRMSVMAGDLLKKFGPITMLDYGCGKGAFAKHIPPIVGLTVSGYDPAVEEFSKRPEPADIVVCLDVLEHVEPDYVFDVLNDLEKLTKKICYVSICSSAATKHYSDGQNMHLIQEGHDFWYPKLRKYFDVVEIESTKKHVNAILQKKGICQKDIT